MEVLYSEIKRFYGTGSFETPLVKVLAFVATSEMEPSVRGIQLILDYGGYQGLDDEASLVSCNGMSNCEIQRKAIALFDEAVAKMNRKLEIKSMLGTSSTKDPRFVVFRKSNGSIVCRTAEDQKLDPIPLSPEWVSGKIIEAESPEQAIYEAGKQAIADEYVNGIEMLADTLQVYLEEQDWKADKETADKIEAAHSFLKEMEAESPLDSMVGDVDKDENVRWTHELDN